MPIPNPDDPTIPVGCNDDLPSASKGSSGSNFMKILREELDKIALSKRRERALAGEVKSVSQDLNRRNELGTGDYDDIDQLAAAVDSLAEVKKQIETSSNLIAGNASEAVKEVIANSPIRVTIDGFRIVITSTYYERPGRHELKIDVS